VPILKLLPKIAAELDALRQLHIVVPATTDVCLLRIHEVSMVTSWRLPTYSSVRMLTVSSMEHQRPHSTVPAGLKSFASTELGGVSVSAMKSMSGSAASYPSFGCIVTHSYSRVQGSLDRALTNRQPRSLACAPGGCSGRRVQRVSVGLRRQPECHKRPINRRRQRSIAAYVQVPISSVVETLLEGIVTQLGERIDDRDASIFRYFADTGVRDRIVLQIILR